MKKKVLTLIALININFMFGQELTNSQKFWSNLQQHCGKSYEGEITKGGKEGDGFTGNRLVMQVLSCKENEIKIPFYVGENKSRTWILTKDENQLIKLKHDHRHEDGSEDRITQYGGQNPNHGFEKIQVFPADMETTQRIPYASTNLWWISLDEQNFTYNLQVVGRNRVFSVSFDLSNPIKFNEKPWGWKE